jgi:hypothetical protein
MDRIFRSWDLLVRSFAILRSDVELLWLPIYTALASGAASLLLLSAGVLLFLPQFEALFIFGRQRSPVVMSSGMWSWLFVFYVVNSFIVVFFNVALVGAASDRLAGGQATVNDGLQLAWQRKGKIFQWAVMAATIGMVLRMLESRISWLARLTAGMIGAAWSLACYFVVPVIAAEDLSPMDALYRSADLFTETWGEELTGGYSFGLIFMVLTLPAVFLVLYARTEGQAAMLAAIVVAAIYCVLLSIVSAAAQGIFVAALYHYARTKQASGGFSIGELSSAWQSKAGRVSPMV